MNIQRLKNLPITKWDTNGIPCDEESISSKDINNFCVSRIQ